MESMYRLEELNLSMGRLEYEMFQDIPAKESGSTNLCHGLPFTVFPAFIESQLARKYQIVNHYDTPTVIFIFYVRGNPVGFVGIRTKINDEWMKWSGNIYYAIRQSERSKGYGTAMLREAVKAAKRLGLKQIFLQSSAGNIASQKVIEKNGGKFRYEDDGTRYYVIGDN